MRHAADLVIRNGEACHATALKLRRHCADLRGHVLEQQRSDRPLPPALQPALPRVDLPCGGLRR
jgi:hypothetical protein